MAAQSEKQGDPAARDACWLSVAKEIRAVVTKLKAEGTRTCASSQRQNSFRCTQGPHLPRGRFRQGHALIIGTGDPGIG